MAIDGRINVDVLFHDTDGTASLKVVSLEDSTAYTTGKVAIITGTAGTAQTTVANTSSLTYRNAAGSIVTFSEVRRVAFAYSGAVVRNLTETNDNAFVLQSGGNRVAMSDVVLPSVALQLGQSLGSGTYTIVVYGT